MVSLDKCVYRCNVIEDPFSRIYISNEIEDVNLKVFNMIKGIKESKMLMKNISYECKLQCTCESK